MDSIFTKIINKEIPAYIIDENEDFISILDINPIKKGHVLVIPKIQIDYLFDIDNDLLSKIMPYCKKISSAIKNAIECKRIGISVIGLEVPHAHVHLIPINSISDMNFNNAKPLSKEEMVSIQNKIKSFL